VNSYKISAKGKNSDVLALGYMCSFFEMYLRCILHVEKFETNFLLVHLHMVRAHKVVSRATYVKNTNFRCENKAFHYIFFVFYTYTKHNSFFTKLYEGT
jgi:hypothetical protein